MYITLLDQVSCTNEIKKNGRVLTDFAILTGGCNWDRTSTFTGAGPEKGSFWTKTGFDGEGFIVTEYGTFHFSPSDSGGIKPVIVNDKIFTIGKNYISGEEANLFMNKNNNYELEYGYYPQNAADNQKKLEEEYSHNNLKKTGKVYHYGKRTFEEYEYKGYKYIRFTIDQQSFKYAIKSYLTLSDGNNYSDGSVAWIKVEPISWLLCGDYSAVSEKILFGMELDKKKIKYDGNFENTTLYKYLNNTFKNDITNDFLNQKISFSIPNEKIIKKLKKINPYNFNFDKVSEEEIIKGTLLSDIPVFLHGASGDGKSQRVKQFDEDATIIYLRNSSMESFNGKSVYNSNTGEMIDVMPSWLKKVYEKCDKEPDKLHIVFFDEINNASNVIQGMAFNVVLNKEVNGIWKLPENARIVAAGNEMKDSLSAEELSEPLFNRFAHVYINTTAESWLKWASTPNESYERLDNTKVINEYKIHPSIYAYISYKSLMKKPVLRTKYNGVTPNADPRKWEMASKVLYATGKPDMLRSLVGKELANDFMEFTKKEVITVEDVINHNYDINSINEMNISEKYNLAVGLSVVDKENLEIVRDFVYNVGKEIGATFDTLWAHGNEDRLEYLLEIGGKKQELDFTFLDGENLDKIEPLKKRGLEAHATDFAICLGQRQDYNLIVRGDYWTLTNAGIRKCYGKPEDYIKVILNTGKVETTFITNSKIGARPVLTNISNYDLSKLMTDQYVTDDGLKFVTLGEYPQTVVVKNCQSELENLYKNNKLALTYNYYTIYNKNLKKCKLPEYIYEGKKYVRVNPNFSNERYSLATLSDGKDYSGEYPIWIEVEPIKWFVFENENKQTCLLSRDILFSGVPFSTKKIYDEDFKNTFIKKFMDEEFSKDILRGQTFAKNDQNVKVLKK